MQMKKSVWIVMVMTVLVASSQFWFVHARVLRSETPLGDGCEDLKGEASYVGMATFSVASNNSITRQFARSLAYKLASGPSKKGPGH